MYKNIILSFFLFLFIGCEEKDPESKINLTCNQACEETTDSESEYEQCVIDCESTY